MISIHCYYIIKPGTFPFRYDRNVYTNVVLAICKLILNQLIIYYSPTNFTEYIGLDINFTPNFRLLYIYRLLALYISSQSVLCNVMLFLCITLYPIRIGDFNLPQINTDP